MGGGGSRGGSGCGTMRAARPSPPLLASATEEGGTRGAMTHNSSRRSVKRPRDGVVSRHVGHVHPKHMPLLHFQ